MAACACTASTCCFLPHLREREGDTWLLPWSFTATVGYGEAARVFFPEATNVLLPYTFFSVFLFLATASAHLTSAPHSRMVLGDIVTARIRLGTKDQRESFGTWTPPSRFNSNFTHGRLFRLIFFFSFWPSVKLPSFRITAFFLGEGATTVILSTNSCIVSSLSLCSMSGFV